MTTNMTLTAEQEELLEAVVAKGIFPSIEGATRFVIEYFAAPDLSDLSWAKPYIDEARAQIERGETISAEEFFAEMDTRIKQLGG